jgi:hypothetical protein
MTTYHSSFVGGLGECWFSLWPAKMGDKHTQLGIWQFLKPCKKKITFFQVFFVLTKIARKENTVPTIINEINKQHLF